MKELLVTLWINSFWMWNI